MKKLQCHSLTALLLILLLATSAKAAESLSVLLQKGIFAEETEGNLDAAIKIYEGIVKESDANRSLVAQAQYRLGVCHVKRGMKDEAVAAFRRIIEEFPRETEVISKTRLRLAELGESAPSTVVRKIWADAEETDGRVSSEGHYYGFTDWKTGDLSVRDLKRGQTRRLTNKGSWDVSDEYASDMVFSRDEKQIAYLWTDGNERCEVRIASLEKQESRSLLKYTGWIAPQDWSADGQQIAALAWEPKSQNGMLALVSVATGTLRELRRAGTNTEPSNVRYASDGKHLAYTRRPDQETPEADIYLVSLDDGTETRLTNHPADDRLVRWSPNGNGVIFTSDRRGSTDLWFLPVSMEGKPAEQPTLLRANLGEIQSLGLTESGAFYYGVSGLPSAVFETAVDATTGKVISSPKEIPSRLSVTKSIGPKRLSPNGRLLAFLRPHGKISSFHVEDLSSGSIREIPIRNVRTFSYPKWSDDSHFILVHGFRYDLRHGVYLVDALTGETRILRLTGPELSREDASKYGWFGFYDSNVHYSFTEPGKEKVFLMFHNLQNGATDKKEINTPEGTNPHNGSYTLTPDGKVFFYIRQSTTKPGETNWIAVRRDLNTGKEFEFLHSTNAVVFTFDSSTTGDSAAKRSNLPIAMTVLNPNRPGTLKGIEVTENSVKEQFSVELPPRTMVWPHWFGNKAQLLITKFSKNGTESIAEVWALLGERNEIRKTELALPRIRILGTFGENQILFEKFGPGFSELWAVENFLPPLASAE